MNTLQMPRQTTSTVTLLIHTPHGTTSAVRLELHYRKRLHSVSGPANDVERLKAVALTWAKRKGFTHYRLFGQSRKTAL